MNFHAHSKKTAKRARSVHKQLKVNKKKNKAAISDESNGGLFPAINLLHDPQGTVEKVFRRLRQSKQRFEVPVTSAWCLRCLGCRGDVLPRV